MTDSILYDYASPVAVATLNRPESLNSLDLNAVEALIASARRAVTDGACALIVTGRGRAFCSGADLSGALQRDADGTFDLGAPMRSHYNRLVETLMALPIPVVIAVNGIAAGGGASLALCGDIVIAARSASFRQTFIDIGLIPDLGATWLMPRLIGVARSRGAAMLGETISAETARDWGMIWDVVDDAALMSAARDIATRLAARSASAIRATRQAMTAAAQLTLPQALEAETTLQTRLGREPAFETAVRAFLARRTPKGTA